MNAEAEAGSAAAASSPWSYVPPAPMSVADTGIPEPFLRELALKTLWAHDKPSLAAISDVMGLHTAVVDELVTSLNREGLCEVDVGSAQTAVHFRYRLTDTGKASAQEALQRSRYIGVAPLPSAAYNQLVQEQIERFRRPPLEEIRAALDHLVLPDRLIEVLGQAFFSRRAAMVYGPSGDGKTDIVTSIARTVAGTIIIPYAIYGHGQLIRVFEPDIHKSQVGGEAKSEGVWVDESSRHDRRWLPVSRPIVVVGGDMGADALEMTYDATQGVHNAPLSIVAQGGVLVIDDLGRQRISPKEILNRWVLMMEQGFDSFAQRREIGGEFLPNRWRAGEHQADVMRSERAQPQQRTVLGGDGFGGADDGFRHRERDHLDRRHDLFRPHRHVSGQRRQRDVFARVQPVQPLRIDAQDALRDGQYVDAARRRPGQPKAAADHGRRHATRCVVFAHVARLDLRHVHRGPAQRAQRLDVFARQRSALAQ